jgi:hypothetical protein
VQTHIRNTPCNNKYTTSGEGENEKRAYIYIYIYMITHIRVERDKEHNIEMMICDVIKRYHITERKRKRNDLV